MSPSWPIRHILIQGVLNRVYQKTSAWQILFTMISFGEIESIERSI